MIIRRHFISLSFIRFMKSSWMPKLLMASYSRLRNQDFQQNVLFALGNFHCAGEHIQFRKIFLGYWLLDVPSTAWRHEPYWRKFTILIVGRYVNHNVDSHILSGQKFRSAGPMEQFGKPGYTAGETVLWLSFPAWSRDCSCSSYIEHLCFSSARPHRTQHFIADFCCRWSIVAGASFPWKCSDADFLSVDHI